MAGDNGGGGGGIVSSLPPARTVPLEPSSPQRARLPYRERFLADQLVRSDDVFLVAPTGTHVDVGAWLLKGRVWLLALDESLVIVACGRCGRRALAVRIPYRDLRESQYNHVTGQLALAPVGGLPFRGLALPPVEGYQVLAQIYREV